MDITELKSKIRAALQSGTYSLDIAGLQSPDLNNLAADYFLGLKLTLTPAGTPFEETADSITVLGTGIDLPFTAMALAVEFTLDGSGNPRLDMKATSPSNWRLDQSFKVFEGNLGASLPFQPDPSFRLSSSPNQPSGLQFAGTLDFVQLTNGLATLLGITAENLTGTITVSEQGKVLTEFALTGPALTSIDLFLAPSVDVTFGMNAYSYTYVGLASPHLVPYIALGADIPFSAQGNNHSLPISIQATNLTSPFRFNIDLTSAIEASLSELVSLIGGADLDSVLPPPSSLPLGSSVAMTNLFMDVAADGKSVNDIGLSVRSTATWDILTIQSTGKKLQAKDVFLDFMINTPFSNPAPYLTFGGSIALTPTADFKLYSRFPDFAVVGYLTGNSILSLSEFIAEFVGPVQDVPDINVSQLSFSAQQSFYHFDVEFIGFWPINLDVSLGLGISEVAFSVDYQGGNVISMMHGVFEVGSVSISVSADYTTGRGWEFSGQTGKSQSIPIGSFIGYVTDTFKVGKPPEWMLETTLKDLETGFNTNSKAFSFSITGDIPIGGGNPLEITLGFSMTPEGSGYDKKLSGKIDVAGSIFKIVFDSSPSDTSLAASWAAKSAAEYLEFATVAHAFAPSSDVPELPDGLKLSIKEIALTYDFTTKSLTLSMSSATYGNAVMVAYHDVAADKWIFYFGLAIGKEINLSNLPVIDHVLSDGEQLEVKDFQALVASTGLDPSVPDQQAEIKVINSKIPDGYPTIPSQGLPGQVAIAAELDFGGEIYPISIGAPAKANALTSPSTGRTGAPSGPSNSTVPPPTEAADGTTWFDVQKSFGPVNFQKVGVRYSDDVLWFLMDASMSMAGLTIAVDGLAAGSPLSTFDPEFSITGLGIEYTSPAFSIGGAFIKFPPVTPVTLEFGGTLTVETAKFSATALGGYAEFADQTSMFVFASVDAVIGGPPYFIVEGFSGGFGYNNKLRIPAQDEVFEFPFVAAMSDPNVFGPDPTPLTVLEKLMGGQDPWVRPSAGDFWLALGFKFSTFEIVNSTALVIGEFGNSFSLALIGLSKARFPMAGPETYAYVELQLQAVVDPTEGFFSVSAVLSPNSYLLDPSCKLTGGFAFELWFPPSDHAGDFVLTIGGYSPYFDVPAHYPQMQRVGFNWSIDNTVSISGGLYFAMTPAALMAGGTLSVNYESGNLKAWFDAHAHIIIWYNPFHFKANIGVSVGASYKADLLLCSKTYTVELGADLTLWGPATGGTVTVHWFIISFTVDFGESESSTPERQDWSTFKNVLPPADNVISIVPKLGLQAAPPTQSTALAAGTNLGTNLGAAQTPNTPELWLVRADNFQFSLDGKLPITDVYIGDEEAPHATGDPINIKPMLVEGVTSSIRIKVVEKSTGLNVLDGKWVLANNTVNVPVALWGIGSNTSLPSGPSLVKDQLSGLTITVPPALLGSGTGEINVKQDLQYDPLPPGPNPLKPDRPPVGPIPKTSDQTIANITEIMESNRVAARNALHATFADLGLAPVTDGSLDRMAKMAGRIFVDEPLEIGAAA